MESFSSEWNVKPFDRKGFIDHIRELSRDFRELRIEKERIHTESVHDLSPAEENAEIERRLRADLDLWARFRAKYPRGYWPVVLMPVRRKKPLPGTREIPWTYQQRFIPGLPSIVPCLALDFPLSKPLLEVLRPLLIEVQRWWGAGGGGVRFGTGRQKYPPRNILRSSYLELCELFQRFLDEKPPKKPLDLWVTRDHVIEALNWLREGLGNYQENWVSRGWPSEEEVQEVLELLTTTGPGSGPAHAAIAAVRGAMRVEVGGLGEEALRKLLSKPAGKSPRAPAAPKSKRPRDHGKIATRRVGLRQEGKPKT